MRVVGEVSFDQSSLVTTSDEEACEGLDVCHHGGVCVLLGVVCGDGEVVDLEGGRRQISMMVGETSECVCLSDCLPVCLSICLYACM